MFITPLIVLGSVAVVYNTLHDEYINTYGQVCYGEGVEKATKYDKNTKGVHPIILLTESRERHKWTNELERKWWPENIFDVELVVSIGPEEEEKIKTCMYYGGSITRYRYTVRVRLIEAKTGKIIAKKTIYGDPPRECQKTEPKGLTSLHGEHVYLEQIEGWLYKYVII